MEMEEGEEEVHLLSGYKCLFERRHKTVKRHNTRYLSKHSLKQRCACSAVLPCLFIISNFGAPLV